MDMQMPEQTDPVVLDWPSPIAYEFFVPPDSPVSLLDVLDMDLDNLKLRLKKLSAYTPRISPA